MDTSTSANSLTRLASPSAPLSGARANAPAGSLEATGGLGARPAAMEGLNEQFHSLFEHATEMVLAFDPAGTILYANQSLRQALGRADEEIRGASLFELVHSFDHATCQAWLQQFRTGGQHPRVRLTFVARDGHQVPVEGSATARQDQAQSSSWLHGIFFDVTEHQRAAEANRQSSELFQLLSQHAPCGVFITDATGRLRYANRRWRALADLLHVTEPRGVWWQMVHPDDRTRVIQQWQSSLNGGHEFSSEFRVNTLTAEPRWVRTRLAQSWGTDGRVSCCIGITEDVTLQRQADEVLRQAHEQLEDLVRKRTDQLQETNRELADLVYAVTHDLKAPLRGIARLGDWLTEDYASKLGEDGRALVSKLQARARQLHALVDGILAYSRVGRAAENETEVDMNHLVGEVTRLLDPPPNFTIRTPHPLPTVPGIPHQVHQLFQNLLDNAMKFSDKPEGWVQITCSRAGSAWEFSVADNGPGIPPAYHAKIFALFQRLDTLPDRPGTGIGLSLVKRIVETRGGQIEVISEEGQGTTFRFTWPDNSRARGRAPEAF